MCWECYSCVKACPHQAIDVRGYADFAPLGHSVRVKRDEEKGVIAWRIKFLFNEPKYIRFDDGGIHTLETNGLEMKEGVTY